jgi:hypothetical protein
VWALVLLQVAHSRARLRMRQGHQRLQALLVRPVLPVLQKSSFQERASQSLHSEALEMKYLNPIIKVGLRLRRPRRQQHCRVPALHRPTILSSQ